MEPEGSLLYSQ